MTTLVSGPAMPRQDVGRLAQVHEIFGVDLRTLALFRIMLGLYLIVDLALRARDLTAHYTDFGIMPRDVALDFLSRSSLSLHLANGSTAFQAGLFVLAGVFAVMLLVGWRTRLATVVSWLLLLSLQNRNTMVLSGEDNLALLLLFWAMFLPLGARFSLDAVRANGRSRAPNAFCTVASAALLIQGMSMYFFSALLKSDPIWMPNGTAVHYALNLDYFATPFALWFRQFEGLMQGLTYYVWVLELVGPILIFSPLLHRPLRALLMVAFITMHLGFWLCLEIGLFPLISIIMNLTFMPGWMWDGLERRVRSRFPDLAAWAPRRSLRWVLGPLRSVRVTPSRLNQTLAAIALAFVTVQNLSTLPALSLRLSDEFRAVRQLFGLYQHWTMFAPYPEMTSPWPVITGMLVDGTIVDVYNRRTGAPTTDRPEVVSAVYANGRWRKFLSQLEDESYRNGPQPLARTYARYLCRSWDAQGQPDRGLRAFVISFEVEWSQPPGFPKKQVTNTVWRHDCFR